MTRDRYTAKQAADFLRQLDDRPGLGNNSLAIAFSGGHGAKRAKDALEAVRTLIEACRTPTYDPLGDYAA